MRKIKFNELKDGDRIISPIDNEVTGFIIDKYDGENSGGGAEMMTKKSIKRAVEQAKFCRELMDRLLCLVEESAELSERNDSYYCYWGMKNHTMIEGDIVRLRRELNVLSNIVSSRE